MSSTPSTYERELNDLMPCRAIYSIQFEHGTLYGLHLKAPKSDVTLDKHITNLDNYFCDSSADKRTRFTSISNTPSLSGKIKTFATGTHGEDMHFKALFSSGFAGRRQLEALPGVKKWIPSGDGGTEEQEDPFIEEAGVTAKHQGGKPTDNANDQQTRKRSRTESANEFLDDTTEMQEQTIHSSRLEESRSISELTTKMENYKAKAKNHKLKLLKSEEETKNKSTEVENLKNDLAKSEADITQYKADLARFEDETRTNKDEVEKLKADLDTSTAEVETLKADLAQSKDEAKTNKEEAEKFKAERDSSTTKVGELEAELETSVGQLTADLAESHAGATSSTARNGELTTQLEQSRAETAACQDDLKKAKDRLDKYREEVESKTTAREAIIEKYIVDLDKRSVEVVNLKEDLQEANAQRARFETEAKTLKADLTTSTTKVRELDTKVGQLNAQLAQVAAQPRAGAAASSKTIRDLNTKQTELMDEIDQLNRALYNSKADVQNEKNHNDNQNVKLEESKQKVRKLESELSSSKWKVEQAEIEAKKHKEEAEKYKTQYDILTTASDGPGTQQVNAEIVRLGEELAIANRNLAENRLHCDNLGKHYMKSLVDYEDLQATVNPCLFQPHIHANPLPPRPSVMRGMPYTISNLPPKTRSFLYKTTLSGRFKRRKMSLKRLTRNWKRRS
jgi:multidrug resistance efflux pump